MIDDILFPTSYFYGFDLAAVTIYAVVLFLILFSDEENLRVKHSFRTVFFLLMAVDGLLSAILDVLTAFTNTAGNLLPLDRTTAMAVGIAANSGFLLIHNLQEYFFMIYTLSVTRRMDHHDRYKTAAMMLTVYLLVPIALVVNLFTGFVFRFDPEAATPYVHHGGIYLIYGVAFVYILSSFITIIISQKKLYKRDLKSLWVYTIACLGSVVLQLLTGDIWVELFVQALVLLSLLVSLQARDELFTPATSCYNSQEFRNLASALIRNQVPTYIFLIRMQGLDYYTKFESEASKDLVVYELAREVRRISGVSDVYDCGNNTLAFITDPLPKGKMRRMYAEAIKAHQDWKARDHVSIQMAMIRIPEDAPSIEALFMFVDAKYRKNKDHPFFVRQDEIAAMNETAEIERALKFAIDHKTLRNVYQPIVDQKGKIHSAEVLSRIHDDKLGDIPPYRFIEIAEQDGLIWEVGLLTIENACRLLSEPVVSKNLSYVEVNLSAVQFAHGGIRDAAMEILEAYGIRPDQINFEVTESAWIRDPETFHKEREELTACGFGFSIDDYGSGFSNYQYIRSVRPSIIKLDRDTLLNAEKSRDQQVFYQSIVSLVHSLGMQIVSEGVETDNQMTIVGAAGSDYIQGFRFSKPLDFEHFLEFVEKN